MLKTRVIPSLLIRDNGLVKTVKFDKSKYIGDPINAIKIFNDKEVDELVVLDIEASKRSSGINFNLLSRINKEAFMPLGYGGGIKSIEDVKRILGLGYEKIIINSSAINNPDIISEAANVCGSQSVVVCLDIKKSLFGNYLLYNYKRKKTFSIDPFEYIKKMEELGAGELIVYSVDRDGTFSGYDISLLKKVTSIVSIPVVALGGAGKFEDFVDAIKLGGASAVSAGSFFVFHGPHKAVLITYPDKQQLKELLPNILVSLKK